MIMNMANYLKTKMVATSNSTHLPGVNYHGFNHIYSKLSEAKVMARQIVKLDINSFPSDLTSRIIFLPSRLKLKLIFLLKI